MGPAVKVHAFNHLLGECGVGFYAKAKAGCRPAAGVSPLSRSRSLIAAHPHMAIRPKLDQWFESQDIGSALVGEFDDFSLLQTFAEAAYGIFAAHLCFTERCRAGTVLSTSAKRSRCRPSSTRFPWNGRSKARRSARSAMLLDTMFSDLTAMLKNNDLAIQAGPFCCCRADLSTRALCFGFGRAEGVDEQRKQMQRAASRSRSRQLGH
jgi:hypothetical protein